MHRALINLSCSLFLPCFIRSLFCSFILSQFARSYSFAVSPVLSRPSVSLFFHSFVRSFVRSFDRSSVRSCVRAFVCSCVRLFVPSFFRSFVRSLVRSYVKPAVLQSVVRSFARSLVRFSLGSFKLGFTSDAITFTSTSTSARESVNTIILISS